MLDILEYGIMEVLRDVDNIQSYSAVVNRSIPQQDTVYGWQRRFMLKGGA